MSKISFWVTRSCWKKENRESHQKLYENARNIFKFASFTQLSSSHNLTPSPHLKNAWQFSRARQHLQNVSQKNRGNSPENRIFSLGFPRQPFTMVLTIHTELNSRKICDDMTANFHDEIFFGAIFPSISERWNKKPVETRRRLFTHLSIVISCRRDLLKLETSFTTETEFSFFLFSSFMSHSRIFKSWKKKN